MSLLTDTIFTGGSTRLHNKDKKNDLKSIRKSKSHGGLLAPLVRLVQNPIAALDNVLSSQISVPETETHAPESDSRRQILYLRMNNVGATYWVRLAFTC
jgi:TAG lipase/steryl ester hydrolase/phospholipase A2/LPA acyltransferase